MSNAMILRGPDEGGVFIDGNVGLAHRRLSIIDLSTGSQPMYSADGQCVIVFNGEIYNFKEIKAELQKEGVAFATTSDTEVLLNGYLHWGIDKLLSGIDGMFAFAIYDKRVGKAFLARDRYGEKPLYYIQEEGSFKFASELKALSEDLKGRGIDTMGLNMFLSLTYIPAPYTIYKGVKKMRPGTYLVISQDAKVESHVYYDIAEETQAPDESISYEEAVKRVRETVMDSVRQRMISDVPMGAFLSGGIDSSVVCCAMNALSQEPINTFSIGFEEKEYDESDRALTVARHIQSRHTQYTLHYNDVLEALDDIILYYDEPFGDSSAIPSYVVAKKAKEKVKMVLTGDAADEIFGGYEKYLIHYYSQRYGALPGFVRNAVKWGVCHCPYNPHTAGIIRKASKVINNFECSPFDSWFNLLCLGMPDVQRKDLLQEHLYEDFRPFYRQRYDRLQALTPFQREQVCDIQGVLEGDMFPKVDRACMHVSLENRTPFIDKRIVKLALSLPDSYKINGRIKKRILRDAFADILPPEILHLTKSGFGVPVDYWLKHELKEDMERLIAEDFIREQGIFEYDTVKQLYEDHLSGKVSHKGVLWNIYVFQKWYTQKYVK
jgi:asparagine synthase (glutamine-hydrolysing)